jgi:hypothetical protein
MKYVRKLSMICVLTLAACGHTVKVQPITVEPIHMTIDINVHDGDPAKPARHESDESGRRARR